jgi:hypothetical protein
VWEVVFAGLEWAAERPDFDAAFAANPRAWILGSRGDACCTALFEPLQADG